MSTRERVLVTGANRGIGLGIVEQYLKRGNTHIFATCRNPDKATELKKLVDTYQGEITIIPLELSDSNSIEKSFEVVNEHVNGLDVLINNASARFPNEQELFGAIKAEEFLYSMNVNAVAPGFLATPISEALRKTPVGETINSRIPLGYGDVSCTVPTVLFLSSSESDYITGQCIAVDGGLSCCHDMGPEFRGFDRPDTN